MSKQGRLLKNTAILFLGTIGTKLINFIMLPLYTDWLSVEEYGIIDVFTTIVSMAVPILTLQLDQAIFRFMLDDETPQKRTVTVSTALGALGVMLLVIDVPVAAVLIWQQSWRYLLYLLAVNLQCLYVMCQQVLRGKGENHIYTVNSILLAFATMALTVLMVRVLPWGVDGYVLAFCVAHLLAIGYMVIQSKIYALIRPAAFVGEKLGQLLRYSVPMIVNNVSWWILNASDKLVLNIFIGASANGIFAAAGKIPGLVTTVYSVFQMAWQESASREKEGQLDRFYSDVLRKLFAVLSYMVIGLFLFGRVLCGILINEKFADSYNHVPILVLGLLFLCVAQFYGGIYVGKKMSLELGRTSAIAAVVNLTVDLLCVHFIGIYAASISTLCAYAVLLVIRFVDVQRICHIEYRIRELVPSAVMLVVAFICAYLNNIWLQAVIFCIISAVYFLLYRDVLGDVLVALRKKLKK